MGINNNYWTAILNWEHHFWKVKVESSQYRIVCREKCFLMVLWFVLDVPVVNVLQLSYSTNIGSSVTLRCTVTSNPTHNSVYWQRTINGQTSRITTSTNTNKYSGSTVNTPSLTINNVAQSDTGSYRCLADNSIGTGQSQITVLNVAGSKYLVVHINI